MAKKVIQGMRNEDAYSLHYIARVPYAQRETRMLYLDILTPCRPPKQVKPQSGFDRQNMDPAFGDCRDIRPPLMKPDQKKHPVIIYIQGTGFQGSKSFTGLPLLTDLVRSGFIAVTVDYRGAGVDNTRFPDAVPDIKEAIRFLRANSNRYNIDPERIALMGSSSCGHAAMFCAVTGDDPAYITGENRLFSSKVQAVIDLFGPMDFDTIVEDRLAIGRKMGRFSEEGYSLFRNDVVEHPELLKTVSILERIHPETELPPILILHGDQDRTVPLRQSERLYERLIQTGKEVEFCIVSGGGHEVNFWGTETLSVLEEFLQRNIGLS